MEFTPKQMSAIVVLFALIAFVLTIVGEHKKPGAGTPIPGKDTTICQYPYDPSVVLGSLATVFLVASAISGYLSLFYPYKGKAIPRSSLFGSIKFIVFFSIALATSGLALSFLLWPTITEQMHLSKKVHQGQSECPTAPVGLLGGEAFLSFNAALMWLVALALAHNTREDYFGENEIEGENDGSLVPGAYTFFSNQAHSLKAVMFVNIHFLLCAIYCIKHCGYISLVL